MPQAARVRAACADQQLLVRGASTPRHLLQFEGVAIVIGEGCAFHAAAEVLNFADLYSSADEFGTGLGDVLHNQVHASHAAGHSRVHIQSGPEADRTARALGGQLDDPDAVRAKG